MVSDDAIARSSSSRTTVSAAERSEQFSIATFYEFFDLEDPSAVRARLLDQLEGTDIRGSVLVAEEGINGTLAGDEAKLLDQLDVFKKTLGVELANCKFSRASFQPFKRLRIRARPELVAFKQPLADPRERTGTYVAPSDWDELLRRDGVRLIDTRNDFEIAAGSFEGAEDPGTLNFSDFAEFAEENLDPTKDRVVAMYCTGGIRCEKASSYLLAKGFEEVYHLEGGILRYLEQTPRDESTFQGECYVFDERVTVDQDLAPGSFVNCDNCGWPVGEGQDCDACATNQTEGVAGDWRSRSRTASG